MIFNPVGDRQTRNDPDAASSPPPLRPCARRVTLASVTITSAPATAVAAPDHDHRHVGWMIGIVGVNPINHLGLRGGLIRRGRRCGRLFFQRADRSANGINRVSWPTTSGSPHGGGHRMYRLWHFFDAAERAPSTASKCHSTRRLRHVHSCTDNELGFYYARRVISSRP